MRVLFSVPKSGRVPSLNLDYGDVFRILEVPDVTVIFQSDRTYTTVRGH